MKAKETVLSIITALLGIGTIVVGVKTGISSASMTLLFLYAVLFSLTSLLVKEKSAAISTMLLPGLVALFFLKVNPWIYLGMFFVLGCAVFGWHQIQKERSSIPVFRISRILGTGLPLFLTALSLGISLFYYNSYQSTGPVVLVPRQTFNFFLPYGLKATKGIFSPGFAIDPDSRVNDLLLTLIKNEAGNHINLDSLSPSQTNTILAEERKSFSRELGVSIRGDEKVRDLFYEVAEKKAENLAGPYTNYIPLVFAIGVFFAFKALSWPVYWLIIAICGILLWAGKKAHLIGEEIKTITVRSYRL